MRGEVREAEEGKENKKIQEVGGGSAARFEKRVLDQMCGTHVVKNGPSAHGGLAYVIGGVFGEHRGNVGRPSRGCARTARF